MLSACSRLNYGPFWELERLLGERGIDVDHVTRHLT
jgi:hypothetical protein